jgi:hypothetical protein
MNKHTFEMLNRLTQIGISYQDALALRRISMTLHRWSELECGDSDNYKSWAIERDGDEPDSKPYMVIHPHDGRKSFRYAVPDRETGARKRLAKILAKYPGLGYYIQGDPRGAPLYILRQGDIPAGASADSCYNNGIAVYK